MSSRRSKPWLPRLPDILADLSVSEIPFYDARKVAYTLGIGRYAALSIIHAICGPRASSVKREELLAHLAQTPEAQRARDLREAQRWAIEQLGGAQADSQKEIALERERKRLKAISERMTRR